jgi:Phage major capsid protein E
MIDIFAPAVLNRVVQDLKAIVRPPFLLDRYFGEAVNSMTEEIYFDVLIGKPRLSPFVSPLVEGMIVEGLGYTTNSFRPAYIKDKRVFEDGKPARRSPGQPIAGPINLLQQREQNVAIQSADQIVMLNRRLEWMASEVLRTGTVTITGEKYPTTLIDFGRDAALSVELLTTARWNDSGPDILGNLETWAGLIRDKSGANPIDVIMAQNVWNVFRANADVKELLSRYLNLSPDTSFDVGPSEQRLGFTDKGTIGDFHVYIHHDVYVDDNGASQKYLPDNYVLVVAQEVEGVRCFGAIKDEKAGFQPLDYFSKSWTMEDPAVRFLMLQSAPLVVPFRPNASLGVKVM